MARATKLFWDWVSDKIMPMMIERNYSLQGALNWLGSRGVDFSERRFVTAFRATAKHVWDQPLISKLPLSGTVPEELRTSRDFAKPRKYMYHFKVRTVDARTGKVTLRSRALYEMKDLSIATALQHAQESFGWNYENYGFAATNFTFDYMEVNEASL